MVRATGRRAERWYTDLGHPAGDLRLRAARRRRAVALLHGHQRHRVPVPDRLGRARGHREPRRLRPHRSTPSTRAEARVLRPGQRRALRPARDRARRRRGPRDARLPRRRLRRGGGRGRAAHRAAPAPAPGADEGRGAAAGRARTASRSSRARCTRSCADASQSEYDEGGSIGKRYRRQDEVGTPLCITVDYETLEDRTVTVRDRDTLDAGPRRDRRSRRTCSPAVSRQPWTSPKLAAV